MVLVRQPRFPIERRLDGQGNTKFLVFVVAGSLQMPVTRWKTMGIEPGEQQLNSTLSHFGEGLTYCGQRRPHKGREPDVIETGQRNIARHRQPVFLGNRQHPEGHLVAGREDSCRTLFRRKGK